MGLGCNNSGTGGGSSFRFNFGQSCNSCNTSCSNGTINTTDVLYTSGNLSCITVPANSTLQDVLLILAQAICAGGDPNPDYSGYNTYCLSTIDSQIETQEQFVETISNFVCTLRTDFDEFTDTTYTTEIDSINDAIDAINNPNLTSCVAVGIVPTDDLLEVLTKLHTAACDLYTKIDPSTADWDQCFAVSAPTTIVAAFDAVIDMICSVKATAEAGLVLPTFDNTGSCLPAPLTTTDSLVTTVNKIKTKLCQLPTFTAGNINYNCVTTATTLEGTLQNIIDSLSNLMQDSVLEFDPDYFTVTPIDAEFPCQGKQVTLNVELTDRFVAANGSDVTPGTLIDKLNAGDGIVIDDTTESGKVTISIDPSIPTEDTKVKVSGSDDTTDYLINKLDGGTESGFTINVFEDAVTTPSSHKAVISPVINWDTFVEKILQTITDSEYLTSLLCDIDCSTAPSDHFYTIEVDNLSVETIDFDLSLKQDTPLVDIHPAGNHTLLGGNTYTYGPVGVTATAPIDGFLSITNNSSVSITYSFSVRENGGSLVTGSTTGSGTILAGGTQTFSSFGFGNSPDNYNFKLELDI